ncbi:MAG: transketolase [Alphaproteobacteria bacterium]|nr:transketolase [Beijerinckiaceae bacterium]NBQ38211.1 transketolase [Alphaproteobacteria bacterium]
MGSSDLARRMANAIRGLSMDGVEKAKSGHPGLPMGAADIATVVYTRFLKFDPTDPHWADRDRFILSAGHGSMLLYSILYLTGTTGMTMDELKSFRQWGSKTPGHPEVGHTPGVEMTTGPLGQGLATSVGFALAERHLNAEFSSDLVDHCTYVLASDGDLMEGVSQEAIALAGHLKLNRLIVLWDDNGISIDGPLSIADSVDQRKRFESAGWATAAVDGHDQDAIAAAIEAAQKSDSPTLIACKTVIGFGAPKRAGTSKAHGEPLGSEELAGAKAALGLSPEPFDVPADILDAWRHSAQRSQGAHADWKKRVAASPKGEEFTRRMAGTVSPKLDAAIAAFKAKLAAEPQTVATRKASELVLEVIAEAVPELVLGSADLTPSNNTKTKNLTAMSPGNFAGRYIHYGIREHGMAAAMNGMALHGGIIPSGATFMVFTDYCRPSIRLAALMGIRTIQVMTHDSIGLGEDGPTHQPIEHLAALRAMPNLNVFRPADVVETAECWELALKETCTPSILALTRQNLPQLRLATAGENKSSRGAYELVASTGDAQVSIFATGSEVEIAVAAQKALSDKGVKARVVSVPSFEMFARQDDAYRASVIGNAKVKIAVEAAVRQGWDSLIGNDGIFVGMNGFGASAPYKELYAHFGITAEAIVEKALSRLG